MSKRLSVVISQSPSKNPVKRKLEEDIVAALLFENGIDVTVVPNLYDIKPDSTSMLALNSISGNVVVCSWLFERAGHWVLDRFGVMGQVGAVLLANDDEEEFDENTEDPSTDDKPVVNDSREIPKRKIYCLDFKASNKADDFIEEVKRIYAENAVNVVTLGDVIGASDNGNPSNGLPIASAAVQPSDGCLLYTSPSPRDRTRSRMPSSA